nr:MAG TPA_asm: hypothetical protein [Caudoviricetes sp.]
MFVCAPIHTGSDQLCHRVNVPGPRRYPIRRSQPFQHALLTPSKHLPSHPPLTNVATSAANDTKKVILLTRSKSENFLQPLSGPLL